VTATPERTAERSAAGGFEKIAVEYSPAILGYVARRIGNIDSAPEVLNDVLLVAWRKRDQLPSDPERLRMWLFVTARNCLHNYERSSNRRRAHESPLAELVEAITPNHDEFAEEIRALVLALPRKYRELVMLIHWEGFTIAGAAELLRLSDSTARTRYARARARLRAALEAE
jgi:RNA polymerase sigma-70 factor (ECF subfamily)